jgi:transcriptional regulator with XRE-family HTH domain
MAKKRVRRTSTYDVHVAQQVRAKRLALGLSQTTVANVIGVAFQQIQKYENGKNRISAGRLWQLAKLFKVPVDYFFEGLK